MTLTTTTDHRPLLDPEAAPEGRDDGRDDGRAGRLRHRVALALAVLVQPLAGLGLLDRYRAAVLEKIPDAAPGAVKAGVWAGWLFGSVLGAIGVLLAVLLAGAAGAAACRLAGARDGFARDHATVGTVAALYFVGKLLLLGAGAALVGHPSWDGLVDALGSADLGLVVLFAAFTEVLRRSTGLSPARSAAAALAPTAVLLALCLIPR
ncbi:hypothetical protein ACFVXH_23170 [Kitasatospora sp. NPDC058184]|uniref:hypothetical protein n=1 Tax=Kitasatospora sp. NPDC058184 TaxID=3346370 RepID=UPI0036DAAA23